MAKMLELNEPCRGLFVATVQLESTQVECISSCQQHLLGPWAPTKGGPISVTKIPQVIQVLEWWMDLEELSFLILSRE